MPLSSGVRRLPWSRPATGSCATPAVPCSRWPRRRCIRRCSQACSTGSMACAIHLPRLPAHDAEKDEARPDGSRSTGKVRPQTGLRASSPRSICLTRPHYEISVAGSRRSCAGSHSRAAPASWMASHMGNAGSSKALISGGALDQSASRKRSMTCASTLRSASTGTSGRTVEIAPGMRLVASSRNANS